MAITHRKMDTTPAMTRAILHWPCLPMLWGKILVAHPNPTGFAKIDWSGAGNVLEVSLWGGIAGRLGICSHLVRWSKIRIGSKTGDQGLGAEPPMRSFSATHHRQQGLALEAGGDGDGDGLRRDVAVFNGVDAARKWTIILFGKYGFNMRVR